MTASPSKSGASHKGFVLLTACIVAIANPLAFTGPAVAIPAIGQELQGSAVSLAWITNAFMLMFGSCLMMAGSLADTLGRRKVFLAGVVLLALFSFGLSVASNIVVIDLLRAGQGIAAAAAFAGIMAALAQEFHGPGSMRAFSVIGTSFGIGLAFGPLSSGLLIEAFGWRAIFVLAGLLAALAAVLGAFFVRDSRDPEAAGLDWKGSISFTAALALLTNAVLLVPEKGWLHAQTISCFIVSIALFVVFVRVETHARRPMLDLSLLKFPRFVAVQLLAAAPAYGFVVLLILLPVRFVGIDGLNAVDAGWKMMALCGPLLFLPLLAGMLTRWLSAASLCGIGLTMTAAGLFWLSFWSGQNAGLELVGPLLVIGIGISLPWGLMDGLAVTVVPKERAGMATGIFNTTRVAGEGIALAVVGTAFSALVASRIGSNLPVIPEQAAEIAQHLTTGNLSAAKTTVGGEGLHPLLLAYDAAFGDLLVLLAVITLVTALVIFAALRKGTSQH